MMLPQGVRRIGSHETRPVRIVVAFDSGGLRDVIQHDKTGLLVKAGDRAALARTLDDLLARDGHGSDLGRAGRLYALSAFAPESVARRYAEIYRQVLGANTP